MRRKYFSQQNDTKTNDFDEFEFELKLYYQNKQTIITEHTIVTSLVKGDHKIAKMLIVCGSLRTQL